ncbi:MAG: glycosyltransferase family 2 protein [Planctomycetota bacterium]
MARVLIVVVNYRTPDLVEDGLAALAPEVEGRDDRRVVVVDNGSGDGSAERLAEAIARDGFGAWATLVASPTNGGFAAGNNLAIAPALAGDDPPDFVLLLNPDTRVLPGAIDELVAFAERTPSAGIAGSQLCHATGEVQASTFRFPSLLAEVNAALRLGPVDRLLAKSRYLAPITTEPSRTDWVAGASMLVRREVFERVGLLDDGYFLYFEETDFCRRAADAGFECWYVPRSRVVHLVGQSTGVTNQASATRRRPPYWFASRRRYFRRFHSAAYAFAVDVGFALAFALWRVRRKLQGKPDEDPERFLGDFVRFALLGGGTDRSRRSAA